MKNEMFFHPNGTVKKLVINMKEGKQMLKNKRVVKALTIGLATVLATPSMTAFAAVEDPNTLDENQEQQVTNTPVVVSQNDLNQIQKAQDALVEAENKEKEVMKDAIEEIKPFDGMTDAGLGIIAGLEDNNIPTLEFDKEKNKLTFEDRSDSANEFEEETSEDLEDVVEELNKGRDNLDEALNGEGGVNDKIAASEEASREANVAAASAAGELLKVDDAKKAADQATTSVAAGAQAKIAEDAVTAANGFATEADKKADEAQKLYEKAEEAYRAAAKDAADAKAKAQEALDEGLEDAAEAVEYAKAAEAVALGLEKEMEAYHTEALKYEQNVNTELGKAQEELGDLISNGKDLWETWNTKHDEYDEATQNWRDMFDAVVEAEKTYNSKDGTVQDIKKQIKDLEKSLKTARETLARLEGEQREAQKALNSEDPKANKAAKDLIDAINDNDDITETQIKLSKHQKALKVAQDAVKAIEAALKNAEDKQAEAEGKITELTTDIDAIKGKYGDISNDQDTVLSNTATAEDKKLAIENLIGKVAGGKDAAKATELDESWRELFPNGLFTDGTKVYTYEVEGNVIRVIECTEDLKPIFKDKTETTKDLSEEDFNNAIKDLIDNTYTYEETTIPGELTHYIISYTEDSTTVARGDSNKYDKIGQKGSYTHGGITYVAEYDKYRTKNGSYTGWAYLGFDGYYHIISAPGQLKKIQITVPGETVSNKKIAASELSQYKDKKNLTKEEVWSDPVTTYTLTKTIIKSEDYTDPNSEEYKNRKKYLEDSGLLVKIDTSSETTGEDVNKPLMWSGGTSKPDYDENGEIKGNCTVTIFGGLSGDYVCSTADGTLKYENGQWHYYSRSAKKFKPLETKRTASVNDSNSKYQVHQSYEGTTTVYTLYFKEQEQDGSTTSYKATENKTDFDKVLSALVAARTTAQDVYDRAQDVKDAKDAYDKALEKYKAADSALTKAKEAVEAQNGVIGGLEKNKKTLEDNLKEARKARNEAGNELSQARWNMYQADIDAAKATAALDKATADIWSNNWAIIRKAGNVAELQKEYDNAKKASEYWKNKASVAKSLAEEATKARELAEAAEQKVKEITLSDIGADALQAALDELAIAEAAYKAAQEKAAAAAEDAKSAAEVYQQILARVQALIDAENAASGAGAGEGEGAGAGETTTGGAVVLATIPTGEEVPGAPAAPVAGGAGVAANVAPAAEATTVDIAPQNSALAATVPEDNKSDDGLATILPQGPALAADIADTEHLTWWWLLVVAVLGGTGYAMYKKFQTKKEEKVTK